MKISLDISLYPLHPDYKKDIKKFIKKISKSEVVKVSTNGLSSQLFGEYDDVMTILNKELKKTFNSKEKFTVIIKMMNEDRSLK
jgi:uncharacterized protein YqgV (UPF0045/DUF77 family)